MLQLFVVVVPPDELLLDVVPPDELLLDVVPPDELLLDVVPPDELLLDVVPPDELLLDVVALFVSVFSSRKFVMFSLPFDFSPAQNKMPSIIDITPAVIIPFLYRMFVCSFLFIS